MITIYAAAISGVLGVAVAWDKLDLPHFVWSSELMELEQVVASNTKLILGDRWIRLTAQIADLEAQLAQEPRNRDLIERLARLKQQLRETEKQLDNR